MRMIKYTKFPKREQVSFFYVGMMQVRNRRWQFLTEILFSKTGSRIWPV